MLFGQFHCRRAPYCRGARRAHSSASLAVFCFNPRPPCGGRLHVQNTSNPHLRFNPRPPCGGRRDGMRGAVQICGFNPRPPCGGRPADGSLWTWSARVSIRAPRAGGDSRWLPTSFSSLFQSAPPVRGATNPSILPLEMVEFQSAPPVRGATSTDANAYSVAVVSIRAPRAGGDELAVRVPPSVNPLQQSNLDIPIHP